jgi:hypothetical protein
VGREGQEGQEGQPEAERRMEQEAEEACKDVGGGCMWGCGRAWAPLPSSSSVWTFFMVRSSDLSLRNGQRVIPYDLHRRPRGAGSVVRRRGLGWLAANAATSFANTVPIVLGRSICDNSV